MKNPILAGQVRSRLNDIVIENSRVRDVHDLADCLMAQAAERPGRPTRCGLLIGPTHSGKTTIVESITRIHNPADVLILDQIPVLHVTLKEDATRKQALQNILSAFARFGYANVSLVGTEAVLFERVCTYLRNAKVKLLVLDEFNHVVHSVSHKVNYSVGDLFKCVLLEGLCPILMVGLEKAQEPFKVNEQLANRCERTIYLHPLNMSDYADSEFYMEFLSRFVLRIEKSGVVVNAPTLLSYEIAGSLAKASRGVLGVACNLIKSAIKHAVGDGRDIITMDDLALANDELLIRATRVEDEIDVTRKNYFCDRQLIAQ